MPPRTEVGPEGSAPLAYVCPHCQTGSLRLRRVVLAHWYGDQFIIIPNFPGWVCDVCGAREYDAAALEQVQMLLGAEFDLRRQGGARAHFGPPEAKPPARASGRRLV